MRYYIQLLLALAAGILVGYALVKLGEDIARWHDL